MHHQWWSPEIQQREQHIYHDLGQNTWIFRNRADGIYFVVGDVGAVGITTIMMVADVVKYTNQRMKHVDYDMIRGYFYA